MSVESEFRKWVEHLKRLDLPVAKMLLPGIDPKHTREVITELGLDCSEELVEFYSYCGGVAAPEGTPLNHIWMYGSHYVLPFSSSVEDYKAFRRDDRWDRSWFPVLGNDGGDFYSSCSLKGKSDWGRITYFMLGSGNEAQTRFSSIHNMLIVINECFDRQICSVDSRGDLATKFFEASVVAMNHNRHLAYYQ